ncbi:MAG: hypothetical protein CFE21_05365 [Bacteroidetes bacterium B1(2017)]|nr:MAG: hypothetical protein CFE21_05365 [Bacteroidetes bacterium B1(2017)]
MKKAVLFLFLLSTQIGIYAQNLRSNCPVKEEVFLHTNSDGSTVLVSVSGSELVQYFENAEGLTLLRNNANDFEYATLNSNLDLIPSGILAKDNGIQVTTTYKAHLRYSQAQIDQLNSAFFQLNQGNQKKAMGKPFPNKGKRKVLALLIQYPNLTASIAKPNFDSMMVKPNYNGTGSFRDYYLKSSFGQLDLQVDVFGWYMASSSYLDYGKSNASYNTNVGNLVKRAVLAADSAGVDFTQYDNDSDGVVDGIIILHAGIGAEEQSAPSANNYIWSHRYNLSYTVGAVLVDGVYVDAYGIFPEKRYNSGAPAQVGIGVISHEFGHLLDLPDLYSTQSKGEGAGNFANMAGGPWLNSERTPCMHDAWTRLVLGWMPATVLSSTGTYTIPKSLVDSNFAYRINTSQVNEYFLLENRQKKDFDKYLPSKGLAIWHINSGKARLLSASSSNNVNNDTSAYGVGLLQADGRRDLETGSNRGDGGDLFPGSTNNRGLNNFSNPNTKLHFKIGGVKQNSDIVISNIIQNADSSITFTIGNKPSAGFDATPLVGCAPLNVNFKNVSAFASSYVWKFHDGSSSTNANQTRVYDSAGTYPVTLYVLDSSLKVVDSVSQTISVNAAPTAKYTLVRSDSNTFQLTSNAVNSLYINWRFGSNQSSTASDLTYKITGTNNIPFMLIAYSSNQCTDTSFGVMSYWPLGIQEQLNESGIEAYPNPFKSEITVQISVTNKDQISISLRDLLGKVVWEQTEYPVYSGQNKVQVQTEKLPRGVYLLEVKGRDFNKILRVSAQ